MAKQSTGILIAALSLILLTGCGADETDLRTEGSPEAAIQSEDATAAEELGLPTPVESDQELLMDVERNEQGGLQFLLSTENSNGRIEYITNLAHWESSDDVVVDIDDVGYALIGRPGDAKITATYRNQRVTMTVTIPKTQLSIQQSEK